MSHASMIDFAQPGGPDPRRSARLRAALCGGLAVLAASSLVMAQPVAAEAPQQVAVSFRDLDLTSAQGVWVLRHRVFLAARRLCKTRSYLSQHCVAATVRQARPQIKRAVEHSQKAAIASVLATVARER